MPPTRLVMSLGLCLLSAPALASSFTVIEDTSPFPAPGIHPPFGAATLLVAKISCADGGSGMVQLPTGADASFISMLASANGVKAPLYLSAEQDGVEPKEILVRFRYADITATGDISAGGSAQVRYPAPSCPAGVTVSFEDNVIPSQKAPHVPDSSGLVPFPAERN